MKHYIKINDQISPSGDYWGGYSYNDYLREIDEILRKEKESSNDDPFEIEIEINSPGGDVKEGYLIAKRNRELSEDNGAKIITVAGDYVFSIATIILISGDERKAKNNHSEFGIHNPWGCLCGESKDFQRAADQLKETEEMIFSDYLHILNINEDQLRSYMEAEFIFDPQKAYEINLINIKPETNSKESIFNFNKSKSNKTPVAMALFSKGKTDSVFFTDKGESLKILNVDPKNLSDLSGKSVEDLSGNPIESGSFNFPQFAKIEIENGKVINCDCNKTEPNSDPQNALEKSPEIEKEEIKMLMNIIQEKEDLIQEMKSQMKSDLESVEKKFEEMENKFQNLIQGVNNLSIRKNDYKDIIPNQTPAGDSGQGDQSNSFAMSLIENILPN